MDKHLHPNHSCEICKPLRPANSALWGPHLGRRAFFKLAGTGIAGSFLASTALAGSTQTQGTGAQLVGKARNVIFIQLQGAPSHVDTFDLKVGDWLPNDFNPTSYNGILFPRGLMPNLADHLNELTIIRSLRAPALVHDLQQIWTQISRNPTSIDGRTAPHIGSVVSVELESQRTPQQILPGFIALNEGLLVGSGFLQAKYTPLSVPAITRGLPGMLHPDGKDKFETKFQMLTNLDGNLRTDSPLGEEVADLDGFYQQAHNLMYNPQINEVFSYRKDDAGRYGGTAFGMSLAVARNIVGSNLGTRFIQVNHNGWDNHANIYATIRQPAAVFDQGLAALLTDLSSMPGVMGGTLLDETLIVAMGEFGRTVGVPGASLNTQNGRDHYFQHFAVLAGGGTRGGTVIGKTNDIGGAIVDPGWSQNRAIVNEDIAATIYSALGIDYTKEIRDPASARRFEYVPFAAQGAWGPVLEVFKREPRLRQGITPRGPRQIG